MSDEFDRQKRQVAEYAVQYVTSGMVIGLGGGTTARCAMRDIAALLHADKLRNILAIPCSKEVETEALRLGIPLTSLEERPLIDLTIDGADEVTEQKQLIKGGGGALLREKIVAQASRREIIIVDERKLSPLLGTRATLPVEVIPFGWRSQAEYLESLGATLTVRLVADNVPYRTDQDNLILDCDFGPITDPDALAAKLHARAGIVAHGLFLGLASEVIMAAETGISVIR